MAQEVGWAGYPGFAPAAHDALLDYGWPGNVRELRNTVERAVYLHGDSERPVEEVVFDPFRLSLPPGTPPHYARGEFHRASEVHRLARSSRMAARPIDLRQTVEAFERELLVHALAANRYSQKATAAHLDLSYHQLRNRLEQIRTFGVTKE